MLAQAPGGLTCFVVPRVLDDGARNPFALQRLKDKLGNRSNASSEVELDGTWGSRLGDEGRGVRTIIDMVAATRLDCVLGSAATMRAALTRAVHHARHRSAFGALLVDQPLMLAVLADLAVESEAATLLGMRLAHAVDEGDSAFLRLAVAAGQVLGLQADAADGRRGAGVPGRQRLRRGERPRPALPRGAAQLHLGGLRQRQRPRRAARRDPGAGRRRGARPRARAGAGPGRPARHRRRRHPRRRAGGRRRRPRSTRPSVRGGWCRTSPSRSRRRSWSATPPLSSPRRSSPAGWAGTTDACSGACRSGRAAAEVVGVAVAG